MSFMITKGVAWVISQDRDDQSVVIAMGLFTKLPKANPIRNQQQMFDCYFPMYRILASLYTDQFSIQGMSAGFLSVFGVRQTCTVFECL